MRSSVIVMGMSQKERMSTFNYVRRWFFEAISVKVLKEERGRKESSTFLAVCFANESINMTRFEPHSIHSDSSGKAFWFGTEGLYGCYYCQRCRRWRKTKV